MKTRGSCSRHGCHPEEPQQIRWGCRLDNRPKKKPSPRPEIQYPQPGSEKPPSADKPRNQSQENSGNGHLKKEEKEKEKTRIYNTEHMTKSNNQACSYCKHNEEAIHNLETQNQATLVFLCSQAALFVMRDSAWHEPYPCDIIPI